MMEMAIASSIIGVCGYLLYIRSIVNEKSQPSRMTWFILASLSIVIAVANFELDATLTLGMLIVNAVGSVIVFLLSLSYGVGGWEENDRIALAGLCSAVILWVLTQNAMLGLTLALSFDFWGLYPTIMKVLKHPSSEAFVPWGVTVLASFLNIFALDWLPAEHITFATAVTPIYFFLINGTVLFLISLPYIQLYLNSETSISRRSK